MSILLHIGAVSTDSSVKNMAANKDPGHIDTLQAADDIYTFHAPPPQQTYSSCFGLPYQDHNYGAPPPPTPPQSPPPMKMNGHIDVVEETVNSVVAKAVSELNKTVTTTGTTTDATIDSVIDDSITRCICDYQHDDGYMICCDKCSVWQHIDCMCIDRNNIPDAYCCEQCEPRLVDKKKARDLQTRKREEIDSSATDTDPDEAAHHIALLKAQSSANKKGKTKRPMKKDIKDHKGQKLKKQKERKKERKEKRAKLGTANNIDVTVTVSKIKLQNNKENAKKFPQLKSPKKSRSVDLQIDEPTCKDAWNSSESPWVDGYEPARNNDYSSALQEILSVNKFNGQHADELKKVGELQVQLCFVSEVKKNRKGLKTADAIPKNKAIVEYVGRVMLKDQYDTNNIFFKMLHPFVLFYSNFDNTNLCIDASNYGNDARFVRRSCNPNAEIRHIVSFGSIRFYIFSTTEIPSGQEITIPFDYQYKDCSFSVECACAKVRCGISKKKRKRSNSQNGERSPIICRTSKRCQAQKAKEEAEAVKEEVPPPTAVIPPDTSFLESLANAAVAVSMAEQSLSEQTTQPVQESPPKASEPVETLENPDISDLLEGETEEQAAERERKMTREERKMQAIMKAFEKLEKREERRKEALARLETTKKTKVEKSQSEDLEIAAPVEVKQEAQTEQKAIKGKRRKSHPARRRSRMNSGNSECTVGSEDSNLAAPVSAPNTPSPNADHTQPRCPINADNNFRFLKTKRHLMNEWLSEKTQASVGPPPIPLTDNTTPVSTPGLTTPTVPSTKVEPLEVNVEETMVFTCLPSPRNTMEYMRRNSHSSCDKPGQGSSIGSAKKRWLRQAMCESGQSSDSGKESPAPYCDGTSPSHSAQLPSPGGSPAIDFVTPLKKRRLARESLSADQPPTPSTLSPPLPSTLEEPVVSAQTLFDLEDSNSNSVTASNSPKSSLVEEKMEDEAMDHITTGVKSEATECKASTLKEGVLEDSMADSSMELDTNTECLPVEAASADYSSCGKNSVSEQVVKVETHENENPVLDDVPLVSSEVALPDDLVNSNEPLTNCCEVSSPSPLKTPLMINNTASSVLPESSQSTKGDEKQTENKEDHNVVSSDSVSLTLNDHKDSGICSSTEIASSEPLCSADTSSSADVVNCENAQTVKEQIHCMQAQPSSTAALDSVGSVSQNVQGSNTDRTVTPCDSAEESSCFASAMGDVSCTAPSLPSLPDRTSLNCDASVVSASSGSEKQTSLDNGNLHVAQSSSSSVLEKLTPLNVPVNSTNSTQPEYDPAVSSTSQSSLPLQAVPAVCSEAEEAFSPGVSSTVAEPYREQVSSVTVEGLQPIAGVVGETASVPAACDSSINNSLTSDCPAPPHLNSSMTVMSADSTSAAPPLPPPPPPQPPPPPGPAKKKVSLLEYRKRLKTKGSGSSTSPCLSLTSGSGGDSITPPQGGNTPTLAPLPFFDPSSPGRSSAKDGFTSPVSKDEEVRWPGRPRGEKLSLTERLRMEFGLEDSDEEDSNPEKRGGLGENSPSPPPPPPPSNAPPPPPVGQPLEPSLEVVAAPVNVVSSLPIGPGIRYSHVDPRAHLGSTPQPVPPPHPPVSGQPGLGPVIPHLLPLQGFPVRPHHTTATSSHPSPRSPSPHSFSQSPTGANKHPASGPLYPNVTPNHSDVNSSSLLQGAPQHQPVYSTPQPQQRPFQRSNSKKSNNYSSGPQRPRLGGQPSYNHAQYSAHAPTRLPHYSSGAVPPPPPVTNSNHPYPGKPPSARGATHSQAYSTRTSSNNSHSYSHKKYY